MVAKCKVARQHWMVAGSMDWDIKKRERVKAAAARWMLKKEECCVELRQSLGGREELPDDLESTFVMLRKTAKKVLGGVSGWREDYKET